MTTAIMVDGGFYKKRALQLFGKKTPKDRADELHSYCCRHLREKHRDKGDEHTLYRIFYYDCPPSDKNVQDPISRKTISLKKTPLYGWTNDFFKELTKQRKVALRQGELLESSVGYMLKPDSMKKLLAKNMTIDELTQNDFALGFEQKGVDMRIGLDIASLAHKRLVNQIVLISGDSDFVPAAKHARREGIDFILDPMGQPIRESLQVHIDGLRSPLFGKRESNDEYKMS